MFPVSHSAALRAPNHTHSPSAGIQVSTVKTMDSLYTHINIIIAILFSTYYMVIRLANIERLSFLFMENPKGTLNVSSAVCVPCVLSPLLGGFYFCALLCAPKPCLCPSVIAAVCFTCRWRWTLCGYISEAIGMYFCFISIEDKMRRTTAYHVFEHPPHQPLAAAPVWQGLRRSHIYPLRIHHGGHDRDIARLCVICALSRPAS